MASGCYTPQYLQASYKGVTFEVLDAGSEHGRRGAVGEFPFGETTAYADLGKKAGRYSISGRFAENSHIDDANALITVVNIPGPGLLVHPTRGPILVACESLRVTDKPIDEQGVTYFDAEFVDAPVWLGGFNFGGALFGIALAPIVAAVQASFVQRYTPDTVRWYQSNAVNATAVDAVGQIATLYQRATAAVSDRKVWQLLKDFRVVENDGFTIRDPASLFTALRNGMDYTDAASAGETKLQLFRQLANWAAKSSALSGEAAVSQDAIYSSVRILAAAHMVRAILETQPTTISAALAQMDMVLAILNEEADVINHNCTDPRLYLALRDFIIEVHTTLLARAYGLPAVISYNFPGGVHALVAAYEIYGDAKRSRDIEIRNPQYLPWSVGPQIIAVRPKA